jgi:ATP-binding cassette subfamily B protein
MAKFRHSHPSINELVRELFKKQVFGFRGNLHPLTKLPEIAVISFVLKEMGVSDIPVLDCPDVDLKALLQYNDLVYRSINIPSDILEHEYQPIITYLDQQPIAVIRRKRQTVLFDGATSRILPLTKKHLQSITDAAAFEIYPPLPTEVSSASDLIPVAFGGQLGAALSLVITSAAVALLGLSIPLFTNYLVSNVIPSGSSNQLIESLYIVFLIMTSVIAAQFLQSRMVLRLETTSDLRLQTAIWDRVMKLPLSILDRFPPADIVSRVDGISKIRGLVSNGISSSLIQAMFSSIYLVLMFVFDQTLATIAILVTAVYIFYVVRTTLASVYPQRLAFEAEAASSEFTYQTVVGYPQIKISVRIFNVIQQWLTYIVDATSNQVKSNYFIDQVSIANGSIITLGNIIIFSLPVYKALTAPDYSSITNLTAQFITFYSAYAAFFGGIISTTSMLSVVSPQVLVLWERANPIIQAPLEPGRDPKALKHDIKGEISISSLSYYFPNASKPLFDNLNLTVTCGSNVAITGPSGCGKTTLVRLMLGLIQPSSGSILVDGLPLNGLSITHFRRQVGSVMQDIKLPPGTIGDVVRGSMNVADEEVWHALELASFAEDVKAMPMQLNTIITSGGASLSGGQRQRLCISRALLKKPKLLFLDEATSALDNKTQQQVTDVFNSLGVTRIIIAHRLSTIRNTDQIFVLREGRIQESGTWDELSVSPSSYLYKDKTVDQG